MPRWFAAALVCGCAAPSEPRDAGADAGAETARACQCGERERVLREDGRKLQRQLQEERRRNDELEQKMRALRAIERDLRERKSP